MAAIVRVQPQSTVIVEWSTAYVAFGIALLVAFGYRHSARHVATALVGLQSIAAVVMTYVANRHLDATGVCLLTGVGLLVIVAAQLPHLMSLWVAPCWIAAQTLALSLATARGLSLADVVTFGLGSAGFQVF